jgi:ADP-heptose:LPS heptosyltransferase
MNPNARNILLCLRYGIGHLVMELPAIQRLREVVPQATITALGAEPATDILNGDRRVDRIVSIRQWGMQHLGDPVDELTQRQFADWLRANQFDLILDPSHATNIVRQIIYDTGIPIGDSDRACLEAGLAQGMDGLSAIKNAIRLGWGMEVPASYYPAVDLRPDEIAWARRFLEQKAMTENLVGMSLGASDDLKRWPVTHFAGLGRDLVRQLETRVLFFAGPQETGLLSALETETHDLSVEVVVNTHLRRVAALLSLCRLYVGNDSGLMHLAAAVRTPVVAFFGPTIPRLYLPRWVRSRAIVSPVECPYRPSRSFGHPRCVLAHKCLLGAPCINAIDPQEALAAVRQEFPATEETLHHAISIP